MNNEDFFAQPVPQRPTPPPDYPAGASAQFGGYAPHEQQALVTARTTSMRNMRSGRSRRLPFFERLRRGLTLARTTGGVVADTPSLLLAPLLALLLGTCAVLLTAQALGGFEAMSRAGHSALGIKLAPLGLILAIISVLAQAVVVDGATERLQLGTPSLSRSWGTALSHLPDLVFFAVLCALENAVTNLLRGNRLSSFLADLFDAAWDYATFFAVPVILYENTGPVKAVKRSAALARSRWAEQLVARGALSLALFVLSLPLLVVAVLIGASLGPAAMLPLVIAVLLLVLVVSATLYGVLSAAIYRYAVTGEVAAGFTQTDFELLFRR